MKTINGLDRKSFEFYLSALGIESPNLPIVGIRSVENSQFKPIRRDYFVLTNDTFALIGVDNPEAGEFFKNILKGTKYNLFSGYRPNFYPEVLEIQRYIPLESSEKENLDSLLAG